jgi:uncharacterized protein
MVLARFLPTDERFFGYFRDAATNALDAARLLVDLIEQYEDVERKVRRLRDYEHRGDEITHQIFNALNSTFVTPFDRDDIRNLASGLDDFVDYLEEAARKLYLYKIERTTEPARLLARIIGEQAQLLAEAIPLLEEAKQHDKLLRIIVDIHRLENEGDEVLSQEMVGIYDDATDIPSLIKAIRWNELYQQLEDTTDRAEDVANTLEGIVLKHA